MKNIRQKIFTGSMIFLFASMAGNLINLVYNAFLGRVLNFSQFSTLTFISTMGYLLGVILSALGNTINHEVAYLSTRRNKNVSLVFGLKILKFSLFLSAFFALFWLLSSPIIVSFFRLENTLPAAIFAPVAIFATITVVSQSILFAELFLSSISALIIFETLIKLISAVLIFRIGLPDKVFLSIPISIIFGSLASLWVLKYKLSLFRQDRLEDTGKSEEIVFPVKFYFNSLVSKLSMIAFLTFDITLIKHFFSPDIAGEYSLLALVGKMVYFLGSLLNILMVTLVSREMGVRHSTNRIFYRFLGIVAGTAVISVVFLGKLGFFFIPLIFGPRAMTIVPYLSNYVFVIALYTLTNAFVTYHLTLHDYIFPVFSLFMSFAMAVGIIIFHKDITQVISVLTVIALLHLTVTLIFHLLKRKGNYFIRNIVDFVLLFIPFPKKTENNIQGMKILIINWRDKRHSFAGGAEEYLHELARRWVKMGNQVTLFCGNDGKSPRYETIDGVEMIRRGGFYLVYLWAFLYYIFRFRGKYDLVIDCENGIPFFTPFYIKEKSYLLVFHIHQEVFRKSLIKPFAWLASALETKIMPRVYSTVQFITISESTKNELLELNMSRLTPKVIRSGVNLNKYKPAEKSTTPVVLYLGRLKYYKSVNIFIKAAQRILEKLPEVKFIIAGDGEERNRLISYSNRLGLGKNIFFLGKVSDQQKVALLQRAWVFVNPSFMEGFGITSIEASACGTPVVASAVGGLRESVKNPHSGFLIPYGDTEGFAEKISFIIENTKTREEMSKFAVGWAANFDWDQSARTGLEIIKGVNS